MKRIAGAILVLGTIILGGYAASRWIVTGDPETVWQEAEADLQSGQWTEARRGVNRLARLREPTDRDRFLRARLALVEERPEDAVAEFLQIPDSSPLAARSRFLAGQTELRLVRLRKAEDLLRQAIALDPNQPQARRELIFILGYQSRHREIAKQFEILSQTEPTTYNELILWCNGSGISWKPEEIEEFLRKAVDQDPQDIQSRVSLAESLRLLNRLDEAAEILKPLPADHAEATAARVHLALERGDATEALALLQAGPSNHAELERLRGRVALDQGDAQRALPHLQRALEMEPDHRVTLQALARAQQMTGQTEEAAQTQARLARLNELNGLVSRLSPTSPPTDPLVLMELGTAHEAAGRFAQAAAWYRRILDRDPLNDAAQKALYRLEHARDEPRS